MRVGVRAKYVIASAARQSLLRWDRHPACRLVTGKMPVPPGTQTGPRIGVRGDEWPAIPRSARDGPTDEAASSFYYSPDMAATCPGITLYLLRVGLFRHSFASARGRQFLDSLTFWVPFRRVVVICDLIWSFPLISLQVTYRPGGSPK